MSDVEQPVVVPKVEDVEEDQLGVADLSTEAAEVTELQAEGSNEPVRSDTNNGTHEEEGQEVPVVEDAPVEGDANETGATVDAGVPGVSKDAKETPANGVAKKPTSDTTKTATKPTATSKAAPISKTGKSTSTSAPIVKKVCCSCVHYHAIHPIINASPRNCQDHQLRYFWIRICEAFSSGNI